jgi:type IV pilus assembly protein PilP
MSRHTLFFCLLISLLIGQLQGCSNDNPMDALKEKLKQIKSRPSGQIEPLPSITPYSSVNYTGSSLRSPFQLNAEELSSSPVSQPSNANLPNLKRTKTDLEQMALENLTMVGSIQFFDEKQPSALIDDGRGKVHKVTIGDYLGQDFGKVADIKEDSVFIEETVQDELGNWIKRPRQLKLSVNQE